jgi:hypothetical protein
MTEPNSTAIGIFGKLSVLIWILMTPLVAFALGTKVVPLDKSDPHGDAVRRIMGCFISSFVFAFGGLLALYRYAEWVYPAAAKIALSLGIPEWTGGAALFWVLSIIGALPGWWIVGPFMRWFASRRDKTITEIAEDARADAGRVVSGK